MDRRAKRLFNRIGSNLPEKGNIADVGSGTGHNAQYLRNETQLSISEFDVEDIHWVGPGPILLRQDNSIPVECDCFDAGLLLYVLQYAEDPHKLLCELRRVCVGPVIVVQSTCEGSVARFVLTIREFLFGRFGYYLARLAGMISSKRCPLTPKAYFSRDELTQLFESSGFTVSTCEPLDQSRFFNVSRGLSVLHPVRKT